MPNSPELKRLIKLLGMTGSTFDGEKLTALAKAQTLMRNYQWTWEDILLQPQPNLTQEEMAKIYEAGFKRGLAEAQSQAPTAPQPIPPSDFDIQLSLCLEFLDRMTDWEKRFLESMKLQALNGRPLSEKQTASFIRVHAKARRCHFYQYGYYP